MLLFKFRFVLLKRWAWRSEAENPHLPCVGGIHPEWYQLSLPWVHSGGWYLPFSAPHGWRHWCRAWTLEQLCLAAVTGQSLCRSQLVLFLEKKRKFCYSIILQLSSSLVKLRNGITEWKWLKLQSALHTHYPWNGPLKKGCVLPSPSSLSVSGKTALVRSHLWECQQGHHFRHNRAMHCSDLHDKNVLQIDCIIMWVHLNTIKLYT